jgi:hypothetical protein
MFEEKLFQLLTDLRSGKHKVKKEFSFSQPDSTEESESFVDDLLFTFGEDSISCDIEWSYYRTKGMGSNDNLTPVDSDIVTLDYIDIENFVYTENEEEKQLEDLSKYPRLKKLFLTYIISLMKDNVIDEVDNDVWKYYVKESVNESTELEKLLKRKEKLEDRLYQEKLRSHQKINNLGWGYGMRCVKMPSFRKEDEIRDKIEEIDKKIDELKNVKESISGMSWFKSQDEIEHMRQKVRILHSKYGTGSKEYEDAFDELHDLIMKSEEEKHDFYSGKLPKPKNENRNIKSFKEFVNENETVNEGIKTWGAGIMMALSLFTNTAMGGDIKKTGIGSSSNVQIAINKAKSNAMSKIGGETNSTTSIKGGRFGQPNIVKDKDDNYVVTIDFTVDSTNVNIEKKVESQRFDGLEAKKFLNDIVDMGYKSDKDVNKFIDKYTDVYDFKISKLNPEQIGTIGEISIKLSKTMEGGNTVFCVVTPIGK